MKISKKTTIKNHLVKKMQLEVIKQNLSDLHKILQGVRYPRKSNLVITNSFGNGEERVKFSTSPLAIIIHPYKCKCDELKIYNSPLHLLRGLKQSRPPSAEPLLPVLCKLSSTVCQWLLPAGSSEHRAVEKCTSHRSMLTLCSYRLWNDTSTHNHQPESHDIHSRPSLTNTSYPYRHDFYHRQKAEKMTNFKNLTISLT